MKTTKYIFAAFTFMFSMIACEDYLEVEPFGENAETYFQNPDDYRSALIGVYDLLSTTYMSNIIGEIASDNALCGGENANDAPGWQTIDDMIHTADNDQLLSYWRWMYGGISRANFLLQNENTIGSFAGKEQIMAEARFLRSYYYFELVKFFGDVPYTDRMISVEESRATPRMAKSEIYAHLEADLSGSVQHLPWTQSEPGRVTRGAALALLGKIYLYQEKFSPAAQAFDEVIQSGHYELVSDYSQIFPLETENNKESVFEVQYIGTEGGGFDCFSCVEGNIVPGFVGPRFREGDFSPFADGWSFSPMTPELESSFSEGDVRKVNTIFDIDAFIAARPDVGFTEGYEHTGYFNRKYMPYAEGNLPATNLTHSNNYRSIRYSDVLLMAAEAYNRGGLGDVTAQSYLNQVRRRAGLNNITETGSALKNIIWNERRLELAGEGQRFFDQVRTGQTSTIPGFVPGKHEVFPIPMIEIQLSNNLLSQNPGY